MPYDRAVSFPEPTSFQTGRMTDTGTDNRAGRGRLILVAGPSGAGKDRLLRAAKERLGENGVHFVRREITRATRDKCEDHIPVTEEAFQTAEKNGRYLLSWRAHGYGYGVPAEIVQKLDQGIDVVVNVSRTVIGDALARFPHAYVILVTAPKDVLAERLRARGREDRQAQARRLNRRAVSPDWEASAVIVNDGRFEMALDAFLKAIEPEMAAAEAATAPLP